MSDMAIDNITQIIQNVKQKILRKVSKYQRLRGVWKMWIMWIKREFFEKSPLIQDKN